MTLNIQGVGNNPSLPMSAAETYLPDQLIADPKNVVTANANITGAALLARGTVLGLVTAGGAEGLTGTPVAASGNTGNGTLSAIGFFENAKQGQYLVEFTAATTFVVTDPSGAPLIAAGTGKYGPEAGEPQIGFTFTAGGVAMVAGDSIVIQAEPSGVGSYKLCKANAEDGSQVPAAILVDQADARNGDVLGGIYVAGEFNGNALIFDQSWNVAQLTALLRARRIDIKSAVSAADPTTQSGGAMGT